MSDTGDHTTGVKVLVVDDEPRVCQLFAMVLGEQGYTVLTAHSGRDAVALACEEHPRVIVLDIVMPGMDGVATLRELRRRGERGAVIVLTAQGSLETAREAMLLGAHDYVTKPFNLEFLKSVIREAVREAEPARGERGCVR